MPVSVQVYISNGLPAMAIVGLVDKSVAESKGRVRVALSSLGLALLLKRVAVSDRQTTFRLARQNSIASMIWMFGLNTVPE